VLGYSVCRNSPWTHAIFSSDSEEVLKMEFNSGSSEEALDFLDIAGLQLLFEFGFTFTND